MRLTDLLELLEPGTRVWIATGLDLEHDPEAELVAEDEVDRLRLFAVTGYWVDWMRPVGNELKILVREGLCGENERPPLLAQRRAQVQ